MYSQVSNTKLKNDFGIRSLSALLSPRRQIGHPFSSRWLHLALPPLRSVVGSVRPAPSG